MTRVDGAMGTGVSTCARSRWTGLKHPLLARWTGAFATLYEVTKDSSPRSHVLAYVTLGIDSLQTLPMLLHSVYGWNEATQNVAKYMDPVFIIQWGCTQIVPRLCFFFLACVLVTVTFGLAVIIARRVSRHDRSAAGVKPDIFRGSASGMQGQGGGEPSRAWGSIQAFQLATEIIVGMLSTSMTKWLLMPIECLIYDTDDSLSSTIHGAGSDCNPWRVPEVLIAGAALFLLAGYAVFASAIVLFGSDVDLLSRAPRAQFRYRLAGFRV